MTTYDYENEKMKNHTNNYINETKKEPKIKQESIPEKIQGLSYSQNSILRTFIK